MARDHKKVEVDHLLELLFEDTDYEVLVRLEIIISPSRGPEDGHYIDSIRLLAIQDAYCPDFDSSEEDIPDGLRKLVESAVDEMEPEDVEDDLPEDRIN